jgi:DNA-binding MarR family transcriptional regulator
MNDRIPPTTGLRILTKLEERGLVKSEKAAINGRILLQSLTDRGVTVMEACLQTMVEPRWRGV